MNVTLLISPFQFRGFITYLQLTCAGQQAVPFHYQSLVKLVLIGYLKRWTPERIDGWLRRKPSREYRLTMPLMVVKALYEEMPTAYLNQHQQLFFDALHKAIVNHQPLLNP